MFRFVANVSADEHDEFVKKSVYCNLLQSSSWAKIKNNWGHEIVGVYQEDVLVASSLVLIKKLPLGLTMMYLPRGPILDYKNEALVQFYFKELKRWAKKYHCLFIKVDPNIHLSEFKIKTTDPIANSEALAVIDLLKRTGLKHNGLTTNMRDNIQPRFQACVYKPENLEESLPKHTKQFIKIAMKKGIKIIRVDQSRMDDFSHVMTLTEQRKHVNLRDKKYFLRLMDVYKKDAYLYLAELNIHQTLASFLKEQEENELALSSIEPHARKQLHKLLEKKESLQKNIALFEELASCYPETSVVAGLLSVQFGNTMELLYAGMDEHFKKFMPMYELYYEQIKMAFSNGCDFVNMGGIEGSLEDGLSLYKANFNPIINEYIGEFDLPVNTMLYSASHWAYKLKKKLKI